MSGQPRTTRTGQPSEAEQHGQDRYTRRSEQEGQAWRIMGKNARMIDRTARGDSWDSTIKMGGQNGQNMTAWTLDRKDGQET
jgi:hypothetical protein